MIVEEASEHRSGRDFVLCPKRPSRLTALQALTCSGSGHGQTGFLRKLSAPGVGHFGTLPRQIFRRMRNLGNYAGSRENLIRIEKNYLPIEMSWPAGSSSGPGPYHHHQGRMQQTARWDRPTNRRASYGYSVGPFTSDWRTYLT